MKIYIDSLHICAVVYEVVARPEAAFKKIMNKDILEFSVTRFDELTVD